MDTKIYRASGSIENASPKDGQQFSLEELQKIVDGYIELVRLSDGRVMVCNEDGKSRNLPMNQNATTVMRSDRPTTDYLVGDVLVCPSDMVA